MRRQIGSDLNEETETQFYDTYLQLPLNSQVSDVVQQNMEYSDIKDYFKKARMAVQYIAVQTYYNFCHFNDHVTLAYGLFTPDI